MAVVRRELETEEQVAKEVLLCGDSCSREGQWYVTVSTGDHQVGVGEQVKEMAMQGPNPITGGTGQARPGLGAQIREADCSLLFGEAGSHMYVKRQVLKCDKFWRLKKLIGYK